MVTEGVPGSNPCRERGAKAPLRQELNKVVDKRAKSFAITIALWMRASDKPVGLKCDIRYFPGVPPLIGGI